jgi:D-sedoheptulose 7-phosphate isomerase
MLDALRDHIALMGRLAELEEQVERAAQAIAGSIRCGGKVLVFGNGGSAADAAHFAAELVGRLKQDRGALPALALTCDGALLTALGNDYGFDRIFERQVLAHLRPYDTVIGITTSGMSANVRRALKAAGNVGSIGLLGRDGGECVNLCDIPIIVPGHDTARIQEAHGFLLHVICARVEELVI